MGTSMRLVFSSIVGCAATVGVFILGYMQGKHVIEIRFVDASAKEVVEKFSGEKKPEYKVTES